MPTTTKNLDKKFEEYKKKMKEKESPGKKEDKKEPAASVSKVDEAHKDELKKETASSSKPEEAIKKELKKETDEKKELGKDEEKKKELEKKTEVQEGKKQISIVANDVEPARNCAPLSKPVTLTKLRDTYPAPLPVYKDIL